MRSPLRRLGVIAVASIVLAAMTVASSHAQPRERGPQSPRPRPPAVRGHVVFIGGYFYDPFFGPYPWWSRGVYPYGYYPVFDDRATLRLLVTPKTAAVHVDGFYAGVVHDFDGVFQGLPLPPGGHTIELYLEGYRTIRQSLYLRPRSTLKVRETMERVPAGERSEPPMDAPAIPPPPIGTTRPPVTARTTPAAPGEMTPVDPASLGTLRLVVQPRTAAVTIDGARWISSDGGRFEIDLVAGRHRIEVAQSGFVTFAQDVDVPAGETVPLNVSLVKPS